MRSSWKIPVAVAATLLAVPQLASADQIEERLESMQRRITELENKLQATNDELETSKERVDRQQELIEKVGIDEARGAGSGSPALDFLRSIELDGFVAASYNYNFNMLNSADLPQPGSSPSGFILPGNSGPSTVGGENGGLLGLTAPGHTNSNSFQLDQLWFGIGKPATMESNAGFRADIVFGALADANREGTGYSTPIFGTAADDHGTGDLPHVYQAYVEYLAPVGENGISFKAGRFATSHGAEVFRQDQNFNITRGITWVLQPVNHTGLMMSGKCSRCSLDWSLGVVNGYSDTMSDRDNGKGVLGGLKWSGETISLATNVFWGGDIGDFGPAQLAHAAFGGDFGVGRSSDEVGVLDAVLTWNPSDRLSTWVNVDYYWLHDNGNTFYQGLIEDTNIYAGAAASRYAITDATGVSMRGEYQWWDVDGVTDLYIWAITGTVDHALTENLIVKVEARYDAAKIRGFSDEIFFMDGHDGPGVWNDSDQVMGLVQMMYKF